MSDLKLRSWIYDLLARTGRAPTLYEVVGFVGGSAAATRGLQQLHDRHMIVLDDNGEIRMALPFAARPGSHMVVNDSGSWWANCAWDCLAIPAALGQDATIEATWLDTGDLVELAIRNGSVVGDGYIHFELPARQWWDDIVET